MTDVNRVRRCAPCSWSWPAGVECCPTCNKPMELYVIPVVPGDPPVESSGDAFARWALERGRAA